jgi:hypothetical protein
MANWALWLIDSHEAGLGSVFSSDDDPAGKSQIAVEPAVEEYPSVDFHPELLVPGFPGVGAWLDTQVRTVGVGADEAESSSRRVDVVEVEGDEGSATSNYMAALKARPGFGFR